MTRAQPLTDARAGKGTVDTMRAAVSRVAANKYLGPGLVLLGGGAAAGVIWFADPTTPGGMLPSCPTNALLHINCPGCGTLRATYSLMHGDLGAAMHYNAVAVVAAVFVMVAFATYTIGLWRGRRIRGWQNLRYTPWVVLAVTLVWFVVRNIPVEPFASLKV